MKIKIIILGFIVIFSSCLDRSWKREKTITLKTTIEGIPVLYETNHAIIKFDKNEIIRNIQEYLNKNEQYDRQVFLEYLLQTNDTINLSPNTVFSTKLDTVPNFFYSSNNEDTIIVARDMDDIRNYYIEPMFWCAYELIRKGKCEIISKFDFKEVTKIKVVHNQVPINTRYTDFFFENDTLFFSALTQLGL